MILRGMANKRCDEVGNGEDAFARFKVLPPRSFDIPRVEAELTQPVMRVAMKRPNDKANMFFDAASERGASRSPRMSAADVVAQLQHAVAG